MEPTKTASSSFRVSLLCRTDFALTGQGKKDACAMFSQASFLQTVFLILARGLRS